MQPPSVSCHGPPHIQGRLRTFVFPYAVLAPQPSLVAEVPFVQRLKEFFAYRFRQGRAGSAMPDGATLRGNQTDLPVAGSLTGKSMCPKE